MCSTVFSLTVSHQLCVWIVAFEVRIAATGLSVHVWRIVTACNQLQAKFKTQTMKHQPVSILSISIHYHAST